MMLSTSSYSKTLIRENLSRYRILSALGLFAYFIAGILPVLMSYRKFAAVSEYARDVMSGTGFTINLLILVIAVSASSWVFGYLHDPISSNAIHSMPVSRKSLFGSSVISGWIMMIAPIVVFAFMTLILRGASTPENAVVPDYMGDKVLSAEEIYTLPHVFALIFKSSVNATFIFAVSCLAAVLAGRKTIHALLALFLLILPNDLALQIDSLCGEYLFGFSDLNINYNLLGPVAQLANSDDFAMNWGYNLYYIALSLVMFALAAWIYGRIKLERVGNATTFPIVGDVLAALLTLIFTVGFSTILASLTAGSEAEKPIRFVIAALISSAIFYAMMRMIADSSPAIFSRSNLKKYGVCLTILAVILVFTALDITGYGKKVPEASEVESVHITSEFPSNLFEVDKEFTDAASIKTFLELQKALIADMNVKSDDDYTDTVSLTWKLKNGRELSRKYSVHRSKEHKTTDAALKKLYELPEYRSEMKYDADKLSEMCSMIEIFGTAPIEILDDGLIRKTDYKGLIEAMNKDLSNMTYEDLDIYSELEESETKKTVYIDMTYKKTYTEMATGKYIIMSERDKNTMEFLRSKGYIK